MNTDITKLVLRLKPTNKYIWIQILYQYKSWASDYVHYTPIYFVLSKKCHQLFKQFKRHNDVVIFTSPDGNLYQITYSTCPQDDIYHVDKEYLDMLKIKRSQLIEMSMGQSKIDRLCNAIDSIKAHLIINKNQRIPEQWQNQNDDFAFKIKKSRIIIDDTCFKYGTGILMPNRLDAEIAVEKQKHLVRNYNVIKKQIVFGYTRLYAETDYQLNVPQYLTLIINSYFC